MRMRDVMLLMLLAMLAACDTPDRQPPDLVKTQRQAMEKAKGVEQVLQQSNHQRREQGDQQI